ncbi:MAG: HD domain-containing protein [Candidatus Andersenbacteria bacterium]|nr:HD domain-containing protein [Candidatus Andersenbacteria bacterium]
MASACEDRVKKLLTKDVTGHDWYHIERVRKLAAQIAKAEGVDMFLVDLMTLLHESADRKLIGKKTEAKALLETRTFLTKLGLPNEAAEEVIYVIANQSYSKSGISGEKLDSRAGQCLQDADRLEALGAIGIARCFAFNGKKGNPIYDPTIKPRLNLSHQEYVKDEATSINHFYEKLFKIKGLMNTKIGKKLAAHRHKFMENFLEEFFTEWDLQR